MGTNVSQLHSGDQSVRAVDEADSLASALDVVVLAGSMGTEPAWTGGLSRPLLPLTQSTVVGTLIARLASECSGSVTVCSTTQPDVFRSQAAIKLPEGRSVAFGQDTVPLGTAGCIRQAAARLGSKAFMVVAGSLWLEGGLAHIVRQHREQGNALTIGCRPGSAGTTHWRGADMRPVSVYCCDPVVLDFIPGSGYFDLKEQLIPALVAADLRVGAVILEPHTREVLDWPTYLHAVERSLSDGRLAESGLSALAPDVWCGNGVKIADNARIVGPVFLGNECRIGNEAVVVGPAILGDRTRVGSGSGLHRIVAAPGTRFPKGTSIVDRYVMPDAIDDMVDVHEADRARVRDQMNAGAKQPPPSKEAPPASHVATAWAWGGGAFLIALFLWAFDHTFSALWNVWQNSGEYNIGPIVPLATLYMIASRQGFAGHALTVSPAGIGLFAVGLLASLLGEQYLYGSLENLGMVICANGLVMTVIGWEGYRRIWYPLAFLLLMIPLPGRVHDAVMLPLQEFSTVVSAGALEILGVPAAQFGNVLEVGGHQVAVVEACNGLRMALAFLLVAGVVAYVVARPRWQRITVLLSSLPIALICNVVRIVTTTCLLHAGYRSYTEGALHDLMGLLMMPAAVGLIALELWILAKITQPRRNAAGRAGVAWNA